MVAPRSVGRTVVISRGPFAKAELVSKWQDIACQLLKEKSWRTY